MLADHCSRNWDGEGKLRRSSRPTSKVRIYAHRYLRCGSRDGRIPPPHSGLSTGLGGGKSDRLSGHVGGR